MNNQENIIKELGISDFSAGDQNRILDKFTETLMKRLGLKILETLSDSDRIEFESLSKEGDVEKINKFLQEKVPNYQGLMEKEIQLAKEDFKKTLEEIK